MWWDERGEALPTDVGEGAAEGFTEDGEFDDEADVFAHVGLDEPVVGAIADDVEVDFGVGVHAEKACVRTNTWNSYGFAGDERDGEVSVEGFFVGANCAVGAQVAKGFVADGEGVVFEDGVEGAEAFEGGGGRDKRVFVVLDGGTPSVAVGFVGGVGAVVDGGAAVCRSSVRWASRVGCSGDAAWCLYGCVEVAIDGGGGEGEVLGRVWRDELVEDGALGIDDAAGSDDRH